MLDPNDLCKSAPCYMDILCIEIRSRIHRLIHLASVVTVIFIMYIARKPTPVILLERYVVVKNKERMSHVSHYRCDKWSSL